MEIIIKIIYLVIILSLAKQDVTKNKIDKKIVIYGTLLSIVYMAYQAVLDMSYLYISTFYLIAYIILFAVDTHILRKFAQESYALSLLTILNIISIITGFETLIKTVLVTIFAILIQSIINKITKKKNIQTGTSKPLPLAFFIGVSNIAAVVINMII